MKIAASLLVSALMLGAPAAAADQATTVLAVSWQAGGGRLMKLDARSLQPRSKERVVIGHASIGLAARAPGGDVLALGAAREVRFVDVARMRFLGKVSVGHGYVVSALWPKRDRLVAVVSDAPVEVATIDPLALRILGRRGVSGRIMSSADAANRLVFVVGGVRKVVPARLLVVDGNGGVRTARLPGVTAGTEVLGRPQRGVRTVSPGLAVDPAGRRAVVVTAAGLAVETDLATLATTVHRPTTRSAAASKRTSKVMAGTFRQAAWLGSDTIAVTGTDYAVVASRRMSAEPAGLSFLDTRTWTSRTVSPEVSSIAVADDTLLAFGGASTGDGLTGYGSDGAERFHLYGRTLVGYVVTAGGYAYVGSNNSRRYEVVDPRTGQIVGRASMKQQTILLG